MKEVFQPSIFRCYASFREGKCSQKKKWEGLQATTFKKNTRGTMSNTPCYTSITMVSLTANSHPSCFCLTAHDFCEIQRLPKLMDIHSICSPPVCQGFPPPKKNVDMCWGLNSQYFHIMGDNRGLHTHYKASLLTV